MKQQNENNDEGSSFRTEFIARLNEVSRDFGPQAKLAESIGVSKGALQTWLGGRKAPGFEAIARLAQVTGVSLDWLAFGGDDPSLGQQKSSIPVEQDWMGRIYSSISKLYVMKGWAEPPEEARVKAANTYFAVIDLPTDDKRADALSVVLHMLTREVAAPPQSPDASQIFA